MRYIKLGEAGRFPPAIGAMTYGDPKAARPTRPAVKIRSSYEQINFADYLLI